MGTEMKHTPAPWHVGQVRTHGILPIYGDDKYMVADCGRISKRTQGEAEANARLIAAAPETHKCLDVILAGINVLLTEGDTKTLERRYSITRKQRKNGQ